MSSSNHSAFSETTLAKLAGFVETRLGLHFPPERWRELERGTRAASLECAESPEWYVQRLLTSTASTPENEALASHLTVGETYFFREAPGLRILEEQIIPQVRNRQMHIWSAGCATGEEPYSIAIFLRRIIPDLVRWDTSIWGTDINARSLHKARQGLYGEWSFRGVPESVRTACFSRNPDGRWAIDPSIQRMVRLAHANLAAGDQPEGLGAMDVIFCCNVLMYFSPDAVRRAVDRLHRSLKPGGWLIVSRAEASQTLFREFETLTFPDCTVYRRSTAPTVAKGFLVESAHPVPENSSQENAAAESAASGTSPPKNSGEPAVARPRARRGSTAALVRLARVCANRGKLRDAFRWCEMAIAAGEAGAHVHYLRAAILEEQGSLDEAARSLRRALYLEPHFAMGHFALGNLALRRGRLHESAKHFDNTIVVLARYQSQDILPESSGLTAGRLKEMILRRNNA